MSSESAIVRTPALKGSERTKRHRQKARDSGGKRIDVILSQEAKASLEFLMATGISERDVIDGALRTVAKMQGHLCD